MIVRHIDHDVTNIFLSVELTLKKSVRPYMIQHPVVYRIISSHENSMLEIQLNLLEDLYNSVGIIE